MYKPDSHCIMYYRLQSLVTHRYGYCASTSPTSVSPDAQVNICKHVAVGSSFTSDDALLQSYNMTITPSRAINA